MTQQCIPAAKTNGYIRLSIAGRLREGSPPIPPSSAEAALKVLYPHLRYLAQERQGRIGDSPEKGHKNGPGNHQLYEI